MSDDPTEHEASVRLTPSALVSLLGTKTLADLIDPRVQPDNNDPLMRFAEFWNVIEVVIDATENEATFASRDEAREQLFANAAGGGFGIPIFIQDLVLDHMEPGP